MEISPALVQQIRGQAQPQDNVLGGTYTAVTSEDLYDFYGIASLSRKFLSQEHLSKVEQRLQDLRQLFLDALQSRFGGWGGQQQLSIKAIVDIMKGSLEDEIQKQAQAMQYGMSQGFNVMAAVEAMRGESSAAQDKMKGEAIKLLSKGLLNFGAADYPKIAKGIVDLYEAKEPKEIILAIDFLNDLQHCGGYVLVDFVAGQRDPSNKLGNQLMQEILDFKRDAMSPMDFSSKMSPEILEIVKTQYGEE